MKLHNNIICLEYAELVPSIMSKATFDINKFRKNITVFGFGGNGREILISFESLPIKYRKAVIERYGNPNEYLAKEPISEQVLINWDYVAESFYDTYVLPNTTRELPPHYKKKYTEAASWLKTINLFTSDKRALKRQLNITVTEFWDAATALISAKDVSLPLNPRALKNKLAKFNTADCKYSSLIEAHRFGNENRKKVKDEAEALLLQMIGHHNSHDDTVIAIKYNQWAAANGQPTISPSTVGYRRKQNDHLLIMQRDGVSVNYVKNSKQIHSKRPSAPLLMAVCDDNILDLYFTKEEVIKGKTVKNHQYRVAMYIVKDYYNDYILGYAFGHTVTKDLIYAAFRNAMQHIVEITGDNYLFHQIQSDRWAIDPQLKGELPMYFKSLAHFTPGTAKVSQSKRIEQSFGTVWHQELKLLPYNNYAGHNVTAKEKTNPDVIQALKKNHPSVDQASEVVAHFINNMRTTQREKGGLTRQEEWLEAFKASETSQKRKISTEKRIELFGVTHPDPIKITSAGLVFWLNKKKYVYDIPDVHYLHNVGKKFTVMYEPHSMDQALLTDGHTTRFIAPAYDFVPSALADYKPGDRERINNLLEKKTQMMLGIQSKLAERVEVLSRKRIDAESILQSGAGVPKELSHAAGQAYQEDEEAVRFNPARLM